MDISSSDRQPDGPRDGEIVLHCGHESDRWSVHHQVAALSAGWFYLDQAGHLRKSLWIARCHDCVANQPTVMFDVPFHDLWLNGKPSGQTPRGLYGEST